MKILTHYIAMVIGGCMGFAAAAFLISGKTDYYTLTPTRCRDCIHSRIEKHTGDEQLVCWRHGTHGEIVKPTDFCSNATVKP